MSAVAPTPLQWQVNGLTIAALSWGKSGASPLLALHGWLDNAASYSVLAPLLEHHHVVALDLSGHGRSDKRSADATYQIWDDLPELCEIVDLLGWERFALVGHSRGAAIACLLASAIPERVERLVLLDGAAPQPVGDEAFPTQMRKFLDEKRHWSRRENRVYPSIEAAVASRSDSSLPASSLRLLAERNLRPCEGGFTWTTDLRLRGASAVKLSPGHVQAVLGALDMPTLLLLADGGFGAHPELAAQTRRHIRQLEVGSISGGHHFHMEPCAAIVASRISCFLQGREWRDRDE